MRDVARLQVQGRQRQDGPDGRQLRRSGAIPAEASLRTESINRPWLNTAGLPEMRTGDYDKLVQKWVDATGEFPG
jgi:hypothetical protein